MLAALALFAPSWAIASPTLTNPILSSAPATGPWFAAPYVSSVAFGTEVTAQDASTGVAISSVNATNMLTWWHFDEGAGTTANDSSGYADNGTIVGGATWGAGVFGNALTFNGLSQYVYGAAQFTLEPATATEELWFKTTSLLGGKLIGYESAQVGVASGKYDANVYMTTAGNLEFDHFVVGLGTQAIASPLSYNDGNWHQVAAQISSAGSFLFVDGALVALSTGSISVWQFPGYWHVGAGNVSGLPNAPLTGYFNGSIDEVRISTYIVSSLQIAQDYLAGQAGSPYNVIANSAGLLVSTTQPAGLSFQWHFDESSGTVALDATGNGTNGTLVGNSPYVSGYDGLALNFNGSSQYVYAQTRAAAPNVFTEEFLFKTTQTNESDLVGFTDVSGAPVNEIDRDIIMAGGGYAGVMGFYVYANGQYNAVYSNQYSPLAYNDGNWHRLAATMSSQGMQLYVDGVLVGANTQITAGEAYSSNPYFRAGYCAFGGYFNGQIDEVRLSTVALTSLQVAQDYLNDTLASQQNGKPYEVMYTSTTGASWYFDSSANISLTGANGTAAAQTLLATGFKVGYSTGPNSGINQIEVVAQNRGGGVTETNYIVIVDTLPPPTPSLGSLTNPATTTLQANGVTGTDTLGYTETFDVQAATSATFSPVIFDSGFVPGPTVIPNGLFPNTTYYVRVQTVNELGVLSAFSSVLSTSTLTNPVAIAYGAPVSISSIAVSEGWAALPASPSSMTCEGYELDVSNTNFASGTVYSSATTSNLASTLTVTGLNTGTTMYFRVASINWDGVRNYVALSSANIQIFPSIATIALSVSQLVPWGVTSSSIVVANVGNIPVTLVVSGSTATAGSLWTLSVSSGIETPVLQGEWNSAQPASSSFSTAITTTPVASSAVNYAGGQSGRAVPSGGSVTMWFQFWSPKSTVQANVQQVLQVLYQSVYP
jgi:hypothetical protein